VEIELAAVASRTGSRAERYRQDAAGRVANFTRLRRRGALPRLLAHGVDAVCVATPDDRHFEAARPGPRRGQARPHREPSVLRLPELDQLEALARRRGVLAKVV